jgi:Heterokaryon incompatibility protein (HET)
MVGHPKAQNFHYEALDRNQDSIRLARLQCDSQDGTGKCSLEHHQLAKAPAYTAVSYTWGNRFVRAPILLDGNSVLVGKNLRDFLHIMSMSAEPKSLLLWIDALCINQVDVRERNHQVQMMGRIYNNAESVAVWLGPADQDSDYLFDLLKSKTYFRERLLNSLSALCRRAYWKRAWIRQGILQSNDVTFFCGQRRMYLRTLAWFCSSPALGICPELDRELGGSPVADLIHRDGFVLKCSLPGLLKSYGSGQCFDIRDRVYSPMSLASDRERLAKDLPVDYSQPSDFLSWEVVAYSSWSRFVKSFKQAAQIVGSILEVSDQTTNVEHLSYIMRYTGEGFCLRWIQQFIIEARKARQIRYTRETPNWQRLPHQDQRQPRSLRRAPTFLQRVWALLQHERWFETLDWITFMMDCIVFASPRFEECLRSTKFAQWTEKITQMLEDDIDRM